ncbi:MAG: DNA mismatch repair protein MutS [Rhodobacterales bacterium]|nr:MAG: DNA mismatch repair protein MutS [Rhodobacterales bacterium]
MRRKPRGLHPEERELWQRVAEQSKPLHPERLRPVKQSVDKIHVTHAKPQLEEFRLGQKAQSPNPAHNLTPHITEHLKNAPVHMDRKSYGKMKRGKLGPEGKIDLHGMTLARAHPALTGFIISAHAQGKRLVLVVTGKGKSDTSDTIIPERRGVLRQQVPHWLTIPPLAQLILQITPAHQKHGGEGAYYVYLRRHR